VRVLVTGATGQLGTDLRAFLAHDRNVSFADRSQIDLLSQESVRRGLDDYEPDVVINAAAYTAVDSAEDNEATTFAINARAPEAMAAWLRIRRGVLIHFSTDYVFDGGKPSPYSEDDPTSPLSVYGRSKLEGERAIQCSGADHFIFRTSWVFAHHGRNFLLTMLRLFGERELVRVVADQHGAPTCSFDLARFVTDRVLPDLRASRTRRDDVPAPPFGLYHLTAHGRTTWHGFASAILEESRVFPKLANAQRAIRIEPIDTDQYATRATRPKNSLLSGSKLRAQFGAGLSDWRDQLRACLARLADA